MTIPNTITLDALRHMAVGDIAALSAEELARLQADAEAALRDAKSLRDWLDGAIALKYGDRAAQVRHEAGKDTGTVRFSSRISPSAGCGRRGWTSTPGRATARTVSSSASRSPGAASAAMSTGSSPRPRRRWGCARRRSGNARP